jgi:hypothetical protein
MTPPTNIDGIDITGATIDGQDVQEITVDGQTVFTAGPTNSGISQEEDGDLAEYTGQTSFFNVVNSPTISGSNFAISFGTDGTPTFVETSFQGGQYDKFSMHVHPVFDINDEVMLVDSNTGNVVFGIYFREDNGIFYSGSKQTEGSINNAGANSRTGGTQLLSSANTSPQYFQIEVLNIDYAAESLDIAVDGSTVVTGESFILSGVPDTLQLNENTGSNASGGFVDKIDIG